MSRRRCLEASVKVVRDIAEQQIWHVGTPIRSDSKMLAESRLDARLGVSFAWPRFLPAVGLREWGLVLTHLNETLWRRNSPRRAEFQSRFHHLGIGIGIGIETEMADRLRAFPLPIDLSPVTDVHHQDQKTRVVDLVKNTIITDANSPSIPSPSVS